MNIENLITQRILFIIKALLTHLNIAITIHRTFPPILHAMSVNMP